MFVNRTHRMLPAAFHVHLRLLRGLSMYRNELSQMASLAPKQLGKIAMDVSRHGSSDILVWKNFVDCCIVNVDSFDSKDILRLWKGIGAFYRNYNYKVRDPDTQLIMKLILRAQTVCNGYTCDELSQLAEVLCDFAVQNRYLVEMVTALFSKIAVLFIIRLAEAMPYAVVRVLVAFSRLGISDQNFLDSIATFICNNEDFTAYDLRNILTSYALMGHHCPELLKYATDQFLLLSDMSANDLAILSFVFSTLDYRTDDVKVLFQHHIGCMDALHEVGSGAQPSHQGYDTVDLPSFCHFLDRLGVSIPEHIIRRIDPCQLSRDDFFNVVHLLPSDVECQHQVLGRYSEYEGTFQEHLRVLKYITCSDFDGRDLFNMVCSNLLTRHRVEGYCNTVNLEHYTDSSGLQPAIPTRSSDDALRSTHDLSESATTIDSMGNPSVDKNWIEDPDNPMTAKDTILEEMVRLLLAVPAVWVSESVALDGLLTQLVPSTRGLCDFAVLMSKGLVDGNPRLESRLEAIAHYHGTTLLDVIGSYLVKKGVCRTPRILCAEMERCLGDEATVSPCIGELTVVSVLKSHNVAILPLYPGDFVCLHNSREVIEEWSPPGCAARADVYAAIYYLRCHGLRVSPMPYSFWSEGIDRGLCVLEMVLSRLV